MSSRTDLLAVALALLAAAPCAAVEPAFATEASVGFWYEGSEAGRPVVVLGGTPSAAYAYAADGEAHAVDVAATRWLAPVGDDERTPLALLPYVARASSLAARFGVAGTSRESLGSFTGQESSLAVSLSGDGALRDAELSGEWFLLRSLSLRGGLAYRRERETAASTSVERPSGRADVSTASTRSSGASGALGLALRLGDHEVSVAGSYGASERTRDDASAFTGSAQPFFSTLVSEGITRRATVATRLLLLGRRLAVDASGSYALSTSSSDLEAALSGPYSKGRTIERSGSVETTWYATRRLGLTAGFAYATRNAASGSLGSQGGLRPSRSETDRVFAARVRWFVSARASAFLSASRTETEAVEPPASTTYQRFDVTVDRVTAGAAVRF